MTTESVPAPGATPVECGRAFRPPVAAGPLVLTARFPASAPAGAEAVAGLVEAVSAVSARGVVAPGADVFLVRHGLVVTVPLPQDLLGIRWDLVPGRTERLPALASLVPCGPGGGSLSPGAYELWTRVVFTPDDGPGTESFGGPWPLEVN